MNKFEHSRIIEENKKRLNDLFHEYDPVTGIGSPIKRFKFFVNKDSYILLPHTMRDDEFIRPIMQYDNLLNCITSINSESSDDEILIKYNAALSIITDLRLNHDFEFFAYLCLKVQDKESKKDIPLKLRKPQRKVLIECEEQRLKNKPIRVILTKARQWGGSTFTEGYMFWIQIRHRTSWHGAICADVEDQSKNIRHMVSKFVSYYPKEIDNLKLTPYESSSKNKILNPRGCVIGIGSAQEPDNLRSFDFSMLHLSECGLWKETKGRKPEDLAQSLRATISQTAYSFVMMESTAKGVGNFFHREWLDAISDKSGYHPVFVAWWEIEIYQRKIDDYNKFIPTMSDYDKKLWHLGATLEGINWYNWYKKSENYDDWRMCSEFPSEWQEAFQSTGRRAFRPSYVKKCRSNCLEPIDKGDVFAECNKGKDSLNNVRFENTVNGELFIWSFPDKDINVTDRYVVTVDIGGRSIGSDWSVISVLDRYWITDGGVPEVVACWRGHLDQDLVAWKAAQIAKWYCEALLVVEVNSLDAKTKEGDHYLTILDEIKDYYRNVYARAPIDKVREGAPVRYGWHTNSATKPMIVDQFNGSLRDDEYIERDVRCCNEMDTYEIKANGSYGAVDGCNDDILITRMIGVHISLKQLKPPREINKSTKPFRKKIINEATM